MKTICKLFLFFGVVVAMSSCSNLDESAYIPQPTDELLIYNEPFTTGMGRFIEKSVTGDQKWTFHSNGYAIVTGFVSSVNHANEDWLISPEIDLTNVAAAHLRFDHVARYFANVGSEATVLITDNYLPDSLPGKSTWKQLTYKPFFDPGNWDFLTTEQISLTEFANKKVRIAFRYISTSTKAGTWEIKNFNVFKGEAVVDNVKRGIESLPFTVAEASRNQGSSAWVSGYVIGYVWSGNMTNYILGADTCTQVTNILIADTTANTFIAKTMAVQLPSGVIRNALNLQNVANRSLLGKKIVVFGSLEAYFSAPGVRNVSYAVLPDGNAVGIKPVEPIYTESFASNRRGDFEVLNVVLPTGFTSVWNPSATFGIVATGFRNPTSHDAEGWLISPEIDLTNQLTAKMRFDHALNFATVANIRNEMRLFISTNNGTDWTQLTIPVYPAGTNWTAISSGEINLASYIGTKIKVAFVYNSTRARAATWQIRNFVVYK